jgi:transcriptional regulator with PAS, ATPase and Fis domain
VLNLHIPPLRERKKDIFLIFEHFVKIFDPVLAKNVKKYEDEISELLCSYSWPGNIRELKNFSTRFIVLTRQDNIVEVIQELVRHFISCFPFFSDEAAKRESNYNHQKKNSREVLQSHIGRMLQEAGGNKAEVARRLGISRTTLWRWLSAAEGGMQAQEQKF